MPYGDKNVPLHESIRPLLPRYLLDIAYKGTAYAGWQVQPNTPTVQGRIDTALSTLLRQPIETVGAGRTDTGVHAEHNAAHFDYETALPPRFLHSVNSLLPFDIAITQVRQGVTDDFHARFTATYRAYRYDLLRHKSPFAIDLAAPLRRAVAVDTMNEAAAILLEYTDFASFCKANGNNFTTLCTLSYAHWTDDGEKLSFHVKANRFLRGMVRALVGTLLEVGYGNLSIAAFRAIIAAENRAQAAGNAPAQGLFLTDVGYPAHTLSTPILDTPPQRA